MGQTSVFVQAEQLALRQSVEVQHETNYRGSRGVSDRQLAHADGVNRKDVPVRMVATGWTWAAVTWGAEIGPHLPGTDRQGVRAWVAGIERQLG